MNHERPARPEPRERLRGQRHDSAFVDAHHLDPRTGRVGKRAEHVEHGAHAQFPPYWPGVAHGRMHSRREQESDSRLVDRPGDLLGIEADVDSKRFEHVGRAATARDGAVAVLGDRQARSGRDQRSRRGDIEGRSSVAARAAGVDKPLGGCFPGRDWHCARAHGAGEASDFGRGFALHPQGGQECRGQGRCRVAAQDVKHRRVGLVFGQILSVGGPMQRFLYGRHGIAFRFGRPI